MTTAEVERLRVGPPGQLPQGHPSHAALHDVLRDEYGVYVDEPDAHAHGWGVYPHETERVASAARDHAILHHLGSQSHPAWDWRKIGGTR